MQKKNFHCTFFGVDFQALRKINRMRHNGIQPNLLIFTSFLNGCAKAKNADMDLRECVYHTVRIVKKSGFKWDEKFVTALVNCYARTGRPREALETYEEWIKTNVSLFPNYMHFF